MLNVGDPVRHALNLEVGVIERIGGCDNPSCPDRTKCVCVRLDPPNERRTIYTTCDKLVRRET